jgi:translation initiation factor 6
MARVAKIDFNGDSNVGLYSVASDSFCLVGKSVSEKDVAVIKDILGVPVIQANVYGTSLVGIFAVACKNVLLIPDVIFDNELEYICSEAAKIGVEVKLLKTENTALANNILCNDKKGFFSLRFTKATCEKVANLLGIKAIRIDLADTETPGSVGVLINDGAIFSLNLSDDDVTKVEKFLGFEIGLGSINMGSPMVGSGVVANSKGFLVGSMASGFEIARVEESLGFLNS